MGRPRTGTVERRPNGTFFGRLNLKDGTRSHRIDLPDAKTEAQARAMTHALQVSEDKTHAFFLEKAPRSGAVPEPSEEVRPGSVDAWWSLYIEAKECGAGHRRIERSSWRKWISPTIGALDMATLRPEDVERVRDKLDAAIESGALATGTAENVWSTLTTAMTAATNAKDRRRIRVHVAPRYAAPVHTGILPPKSGRERARPWLYPSEWLTLAACQEVPEEWRRVYAIALYTGLRPNELRVLTWDDIELEAGLVRVNKSWDVEERREKDTKTAGGHRTVPIRPEVRELLRRPAGVPGTARVVPLTLRKIADRFRAHLRVAFVRRPRLFAKSSAEMPVDFRALRDSYATWRALQKIEAYVLRRELGHASLETTDRYVKTASTVGEAAIGAPFPPFSFAQSLAQATPNPTETPMNNGSDCRTRTCNDASDSAETRENEEVPRERNTAFGAVPPGFSPRLGASFGGPYGYEAGLYDVLEREVLLAINSVGGDA